MNCGGAAHPASGCQYTETAILCGRCVREIWIWVCKHTDTMKTVGRKPTQEERKMRPRPERRLASFYEAAGRVIE